MKKLLKVMTLFVAMTLTACGGSTNSGEASSQPAGGSSGQPATSQPAGESSAPVASSAGGESKSSKHTHYAAENAEWQSDENRHWKLCAEDDGGKVDNKAHTFEEKTDDPANKPATCKEAGVKVEVCSVCGYRKESAVAQLEHTFVEDTSRADAATCETAGKKYEVCSVCGFEKVTETGKLPHNWGDAITNYAKEDGYAQTSSYKCAYGEHYALRWEALDMDQAASLEACGLTAVDSTVYAELNSDNIRLKKAENDGGTEKLGTHVVYKVKVATAVENAGLEFYAKSRSGYDVPVFDYVSNDSQQGYIKKDDGTLELTTKRYGLRVNGVEVTLGADQYGNVNGVTDWFDWNVTFNLQAGENVIDVYCLGGYRANIYKFQVTGLPATALPEVAVA